MLLKFGAYALLDEEDDSADTFYNNDIDTILKSSTTQVLYQDAATAAADGSKQGNGTAPAPGAGGAGAGGDGAGSATDAAGGAATNGGGDGSADGDGPRASPAPATVSFAKATFAAASADANLDVQDPAFWEKVRVGRGVALHPAGWLTPRLCAPLSGRSSVRRRWTGFGSRCAKEPCSRRTMTT